MAGKCVITSLNPTTVYVNLSLSYIAEYNVIIVMVLSMEITVLNRVKLYLDIVLF